MALPLLQTKLHIPPLRPEFVPRPRLIERLNAGRHRKLTLISAPAGFGKTTLVAEWLQRLKALPLRGQTAGVGQPADKVRAFAWLSLDAEDNDPVRFFSYLIAALETMHTEVVADARALFQSSQQPRLKAALNALINGLATAPANFVLVLDDYHVIEQQTIHEALTYLLDHLPPQMHLVIAGRADPPLPLARLRTRNQLTEIRIADLRFTPGEAATFLNQAMGLDLSIEEIAALEARTEGWISGLQLAALSMRGRAAEHVAGFVTAFSGSHRHVIDYLAEEVMARQTDEIHDFLCQTAILNHLTAPLCDAVTGREDSDGILRQLEQANLFLIPLDDQRQWYRYHRLFAGFLRNRLHGQLPHQERELHRRASEWYEQNGPLAAAIEHALSATDFERAASLIEQAAKETLMRSEFATFLNWVETLPDDSMRARPSLCLYHAWALLLSNRPLDAIESRLQDAEGEAGSMSSQAASLRAFIAALQGKVPRAAELSRQALEGLPENDLFLRSVVAWDLGLSHLWRGDFAAGSHALERAAKMSQETGNVMVAVVALCHLAEMRIIHGQLHEARALYRQALDLATDGQGQPLPVAGMALIGLGELLREWSDLETAMRHLTEGIALTEPWGEIVAMDGYIALARVKQARGDAHGARAALHRAAHIADKFDTTEMDDFFVAIHQARLWVAQGNLEAAGRWAEGRGLEIDLGPAGLEGHDVSAFFPTYYLRELEHVALARVWIHQGRAGKALALLERLLPVAERQERKGSAIEMQILRAMALQAQDSIPQAMAALERALEMARPEGHVRIFVDEGAPVAQLLRHALAQRMAPHYVRKLLAAFDVPQHETLEERPSFSPAQPLIEPLTERELEVLRLVAVGLSNREVADRLIITVGTAKRHVSNIYAKLGVHNRVQAVAQARELHLL